MEEEKKEALEALSELVDTEEELEALEQVVTKVKKNPKPKKAVVTKTPLEFAFPRHKSVSINGEDMIVSKVNGVEVTLKRR